MKKAGRKIPRIAKDLALTLWLGGHSYREIRDKTGMSLGAINQMIAENRRRTPNLDQLRELNVALGKGGLTVYDAMRGCLLLSELNRLGVGLDELEGFIKLSARISSEKGQGFVESSMKLMDLEAKTGKNYEGVLKDFEERTRQIEDLEARAKVLQEENRKLVERNVQLEGEIREAEKRLSLTRQELNRAISIQEKLQKLGICRVAKLAEFIGDYEALGFDAQEVQRLATWRKSLAGIGIDPDGLERFVKEKGSLEKQLANLAKEKIAREQKVKELKGEHLRLWSQINTIRDEISGLFSLGYALKEGRLTFPCKACRMHGVSMGLDTVKSAVIMGSWCSGTCVFCGQWSSYSTWEAAWFVAQLVLPAIRQRGSAAE